MKFGRTGSGTGNGGTLPVVVICGIGTGGHYFPALVVAQAFRARRRAVVILVRAGYHEEKIARSFGLPVFSISAQPFYGRKITTKIHCLLSLILSTYRLGALMRAGVGFSFGGFGSLPLIIACFVSRRPFYIFEPNAVPGRATRLFARRARRIFLGLPVASGLRGRTQLTGIPIRAEFKARAAMPAGPGGPSILFIGGSQGAKKLNEIALELAATISSRYRITVISGLRDYEWVAKKCDARTNVIPFTAEPWREIAAADIVVSRSGALAGYEILAMRKKAIFVPFPHAIDNHQQRNALFFTRAGRGRLIEEKDLDAGALIKSIEEMLRQKNDVGEALPLDAEDRIVERVAGEAR